MQALGQARLATCAGSGAGAGTLGYQRRFRRWGRHAWLPAQVQALGQARLATSAGAGVHGQLALRMSTAAALGGCGRAC